MKKTGKDSSGPDAVHTAPTEGREAKETNGEPAFAVRPWGEVIAAHQYAPGGLDVLVEE